MPEIVPNGMPDDVATASELLGSAPRTEILSQLAVEPLTSIELAERIGVNHSSIHRNLRRLEEVGVVAADHPRGQRGGRTTVRWTTDTDRIRALVDAWLDYVTHAGESV